MPPRRRTARRTARRTSRRTTRRMDRRMQARDEMLYPEPAPYQEPAPAPAPPPPPAAPAADQPAYVAELEQLASLHQAGVLTDEEFEAKKAQILGL